MGAQTERHSYDVRQGLLAQEEQSRVGGEHGDLFSDLESMQLRQIDIEQNHVRLQFFGLLNGLQPIRRLDDLELRPSLKLRTNETAERRMVLDDENPQWHGRDLFDVKRAYTREPTRPDLWSPSRHTSTVFGLEEEDGQQEVLRHWRDGYRRRRAPFVTQNESRDVGGKDNPGAENRRGDDGNKRGAGLVGILAL